VANFQVTLPIDTILDVTLQACTTTFSINVISYIDDMDNTVSIRFHEQKYNQELSRRLQDFVIPADATIIDN
jgi:outer membrane lipoprotein-sorting protein